MTNPMIRIHDMATDEIIDREMTDAEFAELQEIQAKEAKAAEETAKIRMAKEAAQAKLTALGLSIEDLKALGL